MTSDYLKYWGLDKPPFSLTPDPEMLFLSSQHSECLMRLKYAIFSQKGGALLVSDNAGNGKTSVLARLKSDLDDYYGGKVRVVYIDHPTLTPIEMIGEIANQLGAGMNTTEKIRALNFLRDRLFSLYNENVKVVVIVDEGQMLKDRPDILGELRILLNFCVSDSFLLTFIFSGQKPLDSVLRDMPEFWQRLPVRFFLRNLDFNDTKGLIKYRFEKTGGDFSIFSDDALEGIYHYSEGCPRVICSAADLCLVIGFTSGVKRIGFKEVTTACRDMEASGDGYHYFAFVKSRTEPVKKEPPELHRTQPAENPPSESRQDVETPYKRKPEAPVADTTNKRKPEAPVADTTSVKSRTAAVADSILCPSCSTANPREMKFCVSCDVPLYRKCPACGTLSDSFTGLCPSCSKDIGEELGKLTETAKRDLARYDILEGNHDIWLRVVGVELGADETVLIVFPRGNFITSGPTIAMSKTSMKSSGDPCDIVLTDRRLIIGLGREQVSLELATVDSCVVTSVSALLGSRRRLVLGYKEELYKLMLPYGSAKSRAILAIISSYIQAKMLQ